MWHLRGKIFPPHPHFFSLCGEFGAMGKFPPGLRRRLCRLTCPPPAANSSSRFALRQRAFAALRSPASHLLLAPLLPQRSSFTSAPRRIPRLLCRAEMSRGIHFMDIFPTAANMVGVLGFEPRTSSLSGTRSNQLSYTPSSPKSCLPFGHGPQAPASRDRYFSGAPVGHWQPFRLPFPLSGIPCGFAVLMPASID